MIGLRAKYVFVITTLAFLGVPATSRAKDVLVIKHVVDTALLQNSTLKAARQQLDIFKGQMTQAREFSNPLVSGSFSQIPFKQIKSSGVVQDYSVQQAVPILGKRSLLTKVATASYNSQQSTYDSLALDTIRQAKQAYWNYAESAQEVTFALENLKFQQGFLATVQDHFQSGQATMADLSRTKFEVAKADNDVFEASKREADAASELNRLMGQPVQAKLPPPAAIHETNLKLDENFLIETARKLRPEIQATQKLEEGGKAQVKLADRLLWAPDLQTQVTYQKKERGDGRDSWAGNLGLTLPILSHYKGERDQARANLGWVRAQNDDMKEQVALEVHQSLLNIKLSKDQLKLWHEAVDQATESARLAEESYLEGDVDLSVFFQARRDFVAATMSYVDALRNYQIHVAELERAVGKTLQGEKE